MKNQTGPLPNTKWTVKIGDEELPLKHYAAAIAYADGFARTRHLVKHIYPDRRLIQLLPLQVAPLAHHLDEIA